MFNSKKNQEKLINDEKQKQSVEVLTFLGIGTEFKGKIIFQGTLRIDGYVEGEIEGNDSLIIGEHGIVKGICKVGKAIISGKFKGDLFAQEKIFMKANADVEGKIETPSLIIEEGAHFNGNCKMTANVSDKNTISDESEREIIQV